MYNTDIYSRLLAGESMEDIMEDLTAQANEAQTRYDEFKRLEEERLRLEEAERKMREAAEREAKNAAKRDHLVDLISETLYFIAEHYPTFGVTTAEVDDMSDEALGALADLALMALDMEVAQKATPKKSPVWKVNFLPKREEAKPVMDEAIKPCNLPDNGVTVSAANSKSNADDIFAQFFRGFPFN